MSPSSLSAALERLHGKARFAKTEEERCGALVEMDQAERAMQWLKNKREAKRREVAA